jgi:hypothetical protein
MNFGPLARKYGLVQSRASPIPPAALLLTCGLGATALVASIATKFVITSLPNILLLVLGAVAMDMVGRLAPQSRTVEALRTIAYGLLYLVTTILCGIIAAYAMQRFAFPLQDRFLAAADAALGLNWADFVRWVDGHLGVQRVFHFAYHTIAIQIALPLVVLGLSNQLNEVRNYLLAFAIAFIVTIFISALMPAVGPVVFVDRASFEILKFTGATPVDHLARLRAAGPLIFTDAPGGIATFPSFHTTIAILTPLTLRRYHRIFVVLVVLDAAMLGGTLTEGAHYYIDVLAGGAMAFFAHSLARGIMRVGARTELPAAPLPVPFAAGLVGQPEPSQR